LCSESAAIEIDNDKLPTLEKPADGVDSASADGDSKDSGRKRAREPVASLNGNGNGNGKGKSAENSGGVAGGDGLAGSGADGAAERPAKRARMEEDGPAANGEVDA